MPKASDYASLPHVDTIAYSKQRDSFILDLKQFHASRRSFFKYTPCLAGKPVDLYLLYSKVCALGGWDKVIEGQKLDEIQEDFYLPKACSNATLALRNIYLRYLDMYEKVNFHGEDPERPDFDIDENSSTDGTLRRTYSSRRLTSSRKGAELNPIFKVYNHAQHNIPFHMRTDLGMSVNLRPMASEHCFGHEKLYLSLMSGLRNEVDFALNTCTLLSNKGKLTLKLNNHRIQGMLDAIVAHSGVFQRGEESLRSAFKSDKFETN